MLDEPSAAQTRAAYDAVAQVYAEHFPTTEAEQAIDLAMIDHLVSLLPPAAHAVLDAGCGTGRDGRAGGQAVLLLQAAGALPD